MSTIEQNDADKSFHYSSNKRLVGVDELAEFLGVKKSWLYSRNRETGPGAIPRYYLDKYVKYQLDDVMDWLKKKNEAE